MKIYQILITFALILAYIKSTCEINKENSRVREEDDCVRRVLSEEEQNSDAYKCCLMKKKVNRNNFEGKEYSCIALTQYDYENIKQMF